MIHRLLILALLFTSCGIVPEEETTSESCSDLIDSESWEEAIECYETGDYDETPDADLSGEEHIYLAMWAGAYGGKYGIIGTAIIESLLETDDGGGGSEEESNGGFNFQAKAEEILAAGTMAFAIADMEKCLSLITAIPEKFRSSESDEAVYFSEDVSTIGGIYTLFLFELQKTDFNASLSDDSLSEDELIAKADSVLATLEAGGTVVSDPTLQAQINESFQEVQNQPGANSKEKLESFIEQDAGTK